MDSKKTNKTHLIWVLLALLAYSVQSLGYVGNMEVPVPTSDNKATGGCHSDHHDPVEANTTSDCCEDGCSMMGCHAPSALLNAIFSPVIQKHQTHPQNATSGFVAKRSNSLYRPPALC